jgi:hypothetical protein
MNEFTIIVGGNNFFPWQLIKQLKNKWEYKNEQNQSINAASLLFLEHYTQKHQSTYLATSICRTFTK